MIDVIELLKRASTCAFYAENIKLYEDINSYLEDPGAETSNDLINDINYLITAFENGADADDYWGDISDLRYNLLNVEEALFRKLVQEPVAWMYEREHENFTELTLSVGFEKNFDGITTPLYEIPPKCEPSKREPLINDVIKKELTHQISFVYRDAFVDGILYAEQQHGIGVKDES